MCFVVIRYEMSRDSRYFLSHYELVSLSSMESAQRRETTFFKMQNVCVCREHNERMFLYISIFSLFDPIRDII